MYMAHIGSFVPADCARISITDQILARISSVETCAVPQSSFQVDLTQMATILRRSTPRTLVLIDEFGKVRILLHMPTRSELKLIALLSPTILANFRHFISRALRRFQV